MLTKSELLTLSNIVLQGLTEIDKSESSYISGTAIREACAPFLQAVDAQISGGDPQKTLRLSRDLSDGVKRFASNILSNDFDRERYAPERRDSPVKYQRALAGVCKLFQATHGCQLANGSRPLADEYEYFLKVLRVANYNHRMLTAKKEKGVFDVLYTKEVPRGALGEQLKVYLAASKVIPAPSRVTPNTSQAQPELAGPSNLSQRWPAYGIQPTFGGPAHYVNQVPFDGPAAFGNQPNLGNPVPFGGQPPFSDPAAFGNQPNLGNPVPFGGQPPFSDPAAFGNQPNLGNPVPFGDQPPFGSQAAFGNQPNLGNPGHFGNQPTFSAPPNSYPGALHPISPYVAPPSPQTDQSLRWLLVNSGAFSRSSPPPQPFHSFDPFGATEPQQPPAIDNQGHFGTHQSSTQSLDQYMPGPRLIPPVPQSRAGHQHTQTLLQSGSQWAVDAKEYWPGMQPNILAPQATNPPDRSNPKLKFR